MRTVIKALREPLAVLLLLGMSACAQRAPAAPALAAAGAGTPPPPTITGVTPASGQTGGGTSVTVTGTGFVAAATVSLGGAAVSSVTVVGSMQLVLVTAPGLAGPATLVVTNPSGAAATAPNAFTFVAPATPPPPPPPAAPTVSAVSPASGSTAGGTTITVTGTGFATGATLVLGGAAATSVVVISATALTGVTPAGTAGAVNVTVTNPGGSSGSLVSGFTYTAPPPASGPPAIYSLAPWKGTTAGGTSVTISGSGFAAGTTVTVRGVAATAVTVVSATSLVFQTPPGGMGSAAVVVTTPAGASATSAAGWTYVHGILLAGTGWSRPAGPTTGGTTVTLSGYGFVTGATATFNGIPAAGVTVVNEFSAIAVTPPSLPDAMPVTITNPVAVTGTPTMGYGAQSSTFWAGFFYFGAGLAPGPNAPFVPIEGPAAGGFPVTLTGAGFQTGATVAFGGVAASAVSVLGSGTITCTAPRAPAGVAPAVAVVVTNPDGSTWSAPPPMAGFRYRPTLVEGTSGTSYAADVAPDGSGGVQVVWHESAWNGTSGSHGIYHRRSTDGGRTWSATTILDWAVTGSGTSLDAPAVAVRGTDVFVAWMRTTYSATLAAYQSQPSFASSTDRGVTFGTAAQLGSFVPTVGASGDGCDVAFDSNGTVVVVAEGATTGGNAAIWCATGTVGGQFGSPVRVSPASASSLAPRLAVVGTTNVHVAWLDQLVSAAGTAVDLHVARSTDSGATFTNATNLSGSGNASGPCLVANTARVVAGWAATGTGGIVTAASTDAGKTFGTATTVGSGQGSGRPGLAMDGSQTLVATWDQVVTTPAPGGSPWNWEVLVSRSTDGAATWSAPANLSEIGHKAWLGAGYAKAPAVRAAGGTFALVWSDTTAWGSVFQIQSY